MKTTKIVIKNLFGITEQKLDGKSVEITGAKGIGKTSVLDAIRFALTNRSERDVIIRQGADEGEILIETDTGLSVHRKARDNRSDSVRVRDGALTHTRPAEFLNQIFTPLQLNPIEFTQMSRQEKNRVILNLVEFDWDIKWIEQQFGEIPQGVNYERHILEVLAEIQSEKGVYYQSRQNINRDIKNNTALIAEIARDVPSEYNYTKWATYDIGTKYRELEKIRSDNAVIERAKTFRASLDGKIRGLQAERDIEIAATEREITAERENLTALITRLKAEISAAEDKLSTLSEKLNDKIKVVEAEYREKSAKLEQDGKVAAEYAERELTDISALTAEIETAEKMKSHLNEYKRMESKQAETKKLTEQSEELTRKIELARELPGEILKTAKMPIKGLTVENGIPLIDGLPISNRSDGELLELCVDISISKPGQLQILLLDGAERLDTKNREALYKKCREKGLQLIATRVTDSNEFEVTEL